MKMRNSILLIFFVLQISLTFANRIPIKNNYDETFKHLSDKDPNTNTEFQIGTGIYDITGPCAEVGFMGYAQAGQIGSGISFRLRARAFVIADPITNNRVAFVSADSAMVFTGIKTAVVQQLSTIYGNVYTDKNVLLSGTHTHSGPAGFSMYLMYNIMSLGFQQDNFNVIVNGIVAAIQEAHSKLSTSGSISINSGILLDSNINRSPSAYLNNPASERAQYEYNVDKLMLLLKLQDENNQPLGMINWFAVHGTSMNNTNTLISGDNKGFASYKFEKYMNGENVLPGTGDFVAAFAQTNEGDVSPNTKGAFCDNGLPCDFAHSTCGGTSQGCHGYGPAPNNDNFGNVEIIGNNQFEMALSLFKSATTNLVGTIDYIHTYLDMGNQTVQPEFSGTGDIEYTCHGSLGDAFAGGTTDGPGDFDFVQGTNVSTANPYWNYIASFLSDPTPQEIACQAPKPILLNTGDITYPYPWTSTILPVQIFRIGNLFILGVPGEFTTMSGRRLRNQINETLFSLGVNNSIVVIAGLSNAYSHYITTTEEYHIQRYEGASTLFGPFTLNAYIQEFTYMVTALVKGQSSTYPTGPLPPNISGDTWDFLPPVIADTAPLFKKFGDVQSDVAGSYTYNQTVSVTFWGANPRNNYQTQGTGYLQVQLYDSSSSTWVPVLDDGDFETRYYWERSGISESLVTCEWIIPETAATGTYRIQTFGVSDFFGDKTPYTGTSSTFYVQ